MSTEKNRETFEAELRHLDVKCVRRVYGEEAELYGLEDGGYFGLEARSGWHFWQASRESLVIELPYADQEFEYRHGGTTYFDGPEYRDAVFKAVESHGIKVVSP